jgi:hypothetical protein
MSNRNKTYKSISEIELSAHSKWDILSTFCGKIVQIFFGHIFPKPKVDIFLRECSVARQPKTTSLLYCTAAGVGGARLKSARVTEKLRKISRIVCP